MEAELNKSVIPLRRVKKVQFGILGPDEIVSSDRLKCPYFDDLHACAVGMRRN